ncbi:MFS transporter [Promicromonospora sp. NPDC023987]|uniref:MFS transporter n=1 Tax=Promicromonospora sp. NPDC023987 TaxID=3155360 RepID=UPI0033D7ED62
MPTQSTSLSTPPSSPADATPDGSRQIARRSSPSWIPVIALSFGIGMVVLSEFLPASVLPTLAADIGVSEGTAGLAVAATAIAGALTAPSIAVLLPRADRRTVLIALLATAALSNLVVAVAPSFAVLLAGRFLLGVALAGYWSFAFGAGMHAVPGRAPVVSSALAFGVSIATVVGVPLASVVGDAVGWRTTFGGSAVLTVLGAAALALTLPSVPAHPAAGLRMLREAVRNGRLMAGIGCVGLVAFANFAAFPFIRIAIDRVDPAATSWLLLAWGLGGLVGTVLAGFLARWLRPMVAVAPFVVAAALLLTAAAATVPVLAVAVVLWGFSFSMIPVLTQLWVTRVEPERSESAISLQVTAFQIAITVGAALGGALLDGHGVRLLLVVGAVSAVAAGLGWTFLRTPRT